MFSRKCKPISAHSTPLNATLTPLFPHQPQVPPFKNLTDRKRVVLVYTFGHIKYFLYFEPYTKTIRCFDLSHIWLVAFFSLFKYVVYVYTDPWKPEEGILASGLESQAAVTAWRGCWEPNSSSGRAASAPNCGDTSPLSCPTAISYSVSYLLTAYDLCSCYLEHKVLFMTSVSVILTMFLLDNLLCIFQYCFFS